MAELAVTLLAFSLIVAGVALLSTSAALIVAGLLLLVLVRMFEVRPDGDGS